MLSNPYHLDLTTAAGGNYPWTLHTVPGGGIYPQVWALPEEKPMGITRALYEVFVVAPGAGIVHGPYRVVATDEVKAQVKALQEWGKLVEVGDPDDYDFLVHRIGPVRNKQA